MRDAWWRRPLCFFLRVYSRGALPNAHAGGRLGKLKSIYMYIKYAYIGRGLRGQAYTAVERTIATPRFTQKSLAWLPDLTSALMTNEGRSREPERKGYR